MKENKYFAVATTVQHQIFEKTNILTHMSVVEAENQEIAKQKHLRFTLEQNPKHELFTQVVLPLYVTADNKVSSLEGSIMFKEDPFL